MDVRPKRVIKLNVERLVVDGVPGMDPRSIEAAIQAELARLVAAEGAGEQLLPPGGVPGHLLPPGGAARQVGAQIARTIHGRLPG